MIPEAAVDAALFAVRAAMIEFGPDGHMDGDEEITRAVLEAAAPHMMAQVLEDAADAADDPSAEDMDEHFLDQADVGRWLRARANELRK